MILGEEMIETNRFGIMLEDQCRPEFMFGEAVATKNAGMLQRFQELGLTSGCSFNGFALVVRGSGANVVHANPATDILQRACAWPASPDNRGLRRSVVPERSR